MTTINVATAAEQHQQVVTYTSKGYITTAQAQEAVTLLKKGGLQNLYRVQNIIIMLVGILLCVFPGVVWAWYCLAQGDETVFVRIDPEAAAADAAARPTDLGGETKWSDGRHYWWDGSDWVDATKRIPPGARLSDDGQQWWDGASWRLKPADETSGDATPDAV